MTKKAVNEPVSIYLKVNLGHPTPIKVKPGASHLICPFCDKKTFSIIMNDRLGKCFHPDCCSYIVTIQDDPEVAPQNLNSIPTRPLREILEAFTSICHENLMDKLNTDSTLQKFIFSTRRLDKNAITHSEMGLVPDLKTLLDSFAKKDMIDSSARDILNENIPAKNKLEKAYQKIFEPVLYFLRKKKNAKNNGLDESLLQTFPHAALPNMLVFPHRDPRTNSIVYFSFRGYPNKTFLSWRYPDAPPGLFGLFSVAKDIATFYVVEGQFNVMQALSIHAKIPIVAFGSASACDTKAIHYLAQQLKAVPTVIYDKDEAGMAIIERLRNIMDIRATSVPDPYNDLDDFLRSFTEKEKALEGMQSLSSRTKTFTLSVQKLAKNIFNTRQRRIKDMRRPFEIHNEVAKAIWSDMNKRGKFVKSQESSTQPIIYYLLTEEGRVYNLSNTRDIRSVFANYGLNPIEPIFKFTIEYVLNEAAHSASAANVVYFSWYDTNENTLYVTDGGNGMYKITKDQITWLLNGTNDLMLIGNDVFPIKLNVQLDNTVLLEENTPTIEKDIVDTYPFVSELDKKLVVSWVYGFLFRSHFALSRPLLLVEGEQASGKTTMLKLLGKVLMGKDWNVLIEVNEQNFEDKVIYPSFTVMDNVDMPAPWLNNWLAVIATGGLISRRQFYTRLMYNYPVDTYLAITSRTPKFRRDDVAERLLRCQVSKITSFKRMESFLEETVTKRNLYWSSILRSCQKMLIVLGGEKIEETVPSVLSTRLVSFFEIAASLYKEDVAEMISYMKTKQAEFVIEENVITYLLEEWVKDGTNAQKWVSATALFLDLSNLAKQNKIKLYYKVPQTLIRYINRNIQNLGLRFEIKKKTSSGKKLWKISPQLTPVPPAPLASTSAPMPEEAKKPAKAPEIQTELNIEPGKDSGPIF